jgi:hypothetical protein
MNAVCDMSSTNWHRELRNCDHLYRKDRKVFPAHKKLEIGIFAEAVNLYPCLTPFCA